MSLCPGVKTFTRASQFVFLLPRWYNKVTKGRIAISFLPEGFSSVQFSRSVVSDSLRTHELQHARPPCPSPTPGVHSNSHPLSRWCHPAIYLIHYRPLFLLPPIPPTIRVLSNESTLRMRWPKYRSFSFSIIPSKEHPGLISFRMDWLDLLAVQGTLKSLLQHTSRPNQLQFSCMPIFL